MKRNREDNEKAEKRIKVPDSCVVKNNYLDVLHAHPRDRQIHFDEEPHKYYVEWSEGCVSSEHSLSVTSFVHSFFPEFDSKRIFNKIKEGKNYAKGPYAGKTHAEVKAMWAQNGLEARQAGTKVHNWIEDYYNGKHTLDDIPADNVELGYFRDFCAEVHDPVAPRLLPYRCEWFVFSDEKTKIPGAIDMVYVNNLAKHDGALHVAIYDWKRSKSIKRYNPWEQGLSVCSEMANTNFYHYSLQLNTYKWILETFYQDVEWRGKVYPKIVVDQMYLICLHPNKKRFERHFVPNLQILLKEMIQLREENLEKLQKGEEQIYPFNKNVSSNKVPQS